MAGLKQTAAVDAQRCSDPVRPATFRAFAGTDTVPGGTQRRGHGQTRVQLDCAKRESDLLKNADQELIDVVAECGRYLGVFTVSFHRRSFAF